jgi:rubredoxin
MFPHTPPTENLCKAVLCPECGDELEMDSAVQLFAFTQSDSWRCHSCKLIFAYDHTVLEKYAG